MTLDYPCWHHPVDLASTEHSLAYNAVWSEAALMAAEAGVNQRVSQVSANPVTSIAAIPVTTLATNYNYRAGSKPTPAHNRSRSWEPGQRPIRFVDDSGYTFNVYRICNGTGPNSAQREVESQVEYGPVSQ